MGKKTPEKKEEKKSEAYQLDEVSKKEEEANEDTPLKGNDVEAGQTDIAETKDNEKAVMASADEKAAEDKQSSALLDQRKVRLILAIVGAVLLVLLLLIVAILVIIYRSGWDPDPTYRYIRIVPQPNGPKNLIQFRSGGMPYEGRVYPNLVREMDEFVHNYNPEVYTRTRNVTECVPGMERPPSRDLQCLFDIRTVAEQCRTGEYGYPSGTPCVFIQFNNITGWVPELYSTADFDHNRNSSLPVSLQQLTRANNRMVFLECKGNTIVDQENMGQIEYTPTQGFPIYYFPYDGHRDYMPPFVAIRFRNPATGIGIGITCRLYAKNLNHTDSWDEVVEPVPALPFNLFIE